MTTSADPGSTRGPDGPVGTPEGSDSSAATTSGAASDQDVQVARQDTDADPGTMNPRSGAAARDESSGEYEDTDADPNNLNPRDLREGVSDDG